MAENNESQPAPYGVGTMTKVGSGPWMITIPVNMYRVGDSSFVWTATTQVPIAEEIRVAILAFAGVNVAPAKAADHPEH